MSSNLEFLEREAKSGLADSLVILLHGYGANGADLMGLSEALSNECPTAKFVAPDAPEPCAVNPAGFQWFPVPQFDGSSEPEMELSFKLSYASLHDFVDDQISATGVEAARTILFGFSQGAMMSLHVGPRRTDPLGGIVAASGRLLQPDRLEVESKSRPPVLLLHGDMDEVVPPSAMPEAEMALKGCGFSVRSYLSRGVAHGIPPDSLGLAAEFMRDILSS